MLESRHGLDYQALLPPWALISCHENIVVGKLFSYRFFLDLGQRFWLLVNRLNIFSLCLSIMKLLFGCYVRFLFGLLWVRLCILAEVANIRVMVILELVQRILRVCLKVVILLCLV